MKSSTDYQIGAAQAVLLVGDPKSGKTCVAAAFPAPYFLDVDGNLDSAVRVLGGKKFWYDQPSRDVKEKHDVWKKALAQLSEAMVNPEIETIIVDSLTLLAEFMQFWMVSEHKRMGDTDKGGKPIEALTIPDYGKILQMFRGLIFDLRKTGKHIVVIVHRSTYQDDVTKITHNIFALPGQAKETIGGAFKDVWATVATQVPGKNQSKYILRFDPLVQYPPLGKAIRTLPAEIDFTNKTPSEIWTQLAPLLK